jgi:hypothetical protein
MTAAGMIPTFGLANGRVSGEIRTAVVTVNGYAPPVS